MKKVVLSLLLLVTIPACDWFQYGFMNSIPFSGSADKNPVVYVYLAIDGLAFQTVAKARERGVFSGPEWKLAKFISMFPATSDASWTRILQTEALGGYEYSYYDPNARKIINKGFMGLAGHAIPTLVDGMSLEAPYLKAFDYRANGYLHTIGVYHDIWANLSESFDNLFVTLSGRAENRDSFSSYLLEIDAMGHILSEDDVIKALSILARKIELFKETHPERTFHFTLFSDHGMDFVRVDPKNLVEMAGELPKVGIKPVEELPEGLPDVSPDTAHALMAVPINHTRVTYLSLHTLPNQIEEVARRSSLIASVDVSVARLRSVERESGVEWFGVWEQGNLKLSFAFNATTNRYSIAPASDLGRFGIKAEDITSEMTDDRLFALTQDSAYPDLFYRIRTGLGRVGIKHPADVILSFRPGYAEVGFTLPGGNNYFALSGFHGSLREIGSLGTLLTTESEIPAAVRSETLLSFFPRLKRNIEEKGIPLISGDPHAILKRH